MEKQGIIELREYGKMSIIIKSIMDRKKITVYELSRLTGLRHQTVKAYYNNDPITRVDMDVLSKMCFVLKCKISDVLEYLPPKE